MPQSRINKLSISKSQGIQIFRVILIFLKKNQEKRKEAQSTEAEYTTSSLMAIIRFVGREVPLPLLNIKKEYYYNNKILI